MKQSLTNSKMNKEKRQQFTSFICSKQQKKKLEELIKEAFEHDEDLFSAKTPSADLLSNQSEAASADGLSRGHVLRLKKTASSRPTTLIETSVIPFKRAGHESDRAAKIRSTLPTPFCSRSSSIPIPLPDAPWRPKSGDSDCLVDQPTTEVKQRLAITSGLEQTPAEPSIELDSSSTYNKFNEILRLFQLSKSSDDQSPPLKEHVPVEKDNKIIITEKFFESMNEKDYHLSNDTNKTMNALQKLLAQALAAKQPWAKAADSRIYEIDKLDTPVSETAPSTSSSVVSKKFNFYPTFANRLKKADSGDSLTTSDLIGSGSKLPYAIPLPYKASPNHPTSLTELAAALSPMIPPSPSASSDLSMMSDVLPESPVSRPRPRDALVNAGIGRGKHVCSECGIRTRKPSLLKKHMITHANFRPFLCSYCNIGFKTKGNLVKHMKTQNHLNRCIALGMNTEDDAIRMVTSENIDHRLLEEQAKINHAEPEDQEQEEEEEEGEEEEEEVQVDFLSMLSPEDLAGQEEDEKTKSQEYQNMLFQSIFDDFIMDNNCIS